MSGEFGKQISQCQCCHDIERCKGVELSLNVAETTKIIYQVINYGGCVLQEFTLLVSERCRNAAKKIEMYTHKKERHRQEFEKVPHKSKELSQIVLSASFRRQIVEIVRLAVRADKRVVVGGGCSVAYWFMCVLEDC